MAATVDIKQIKLADGDHEIKAKSLQSANVGGESKPVFFDANGEPQVCNFMISYGSAASKPTTGVNGQIYFVI